MCVYMAKTDRNSSGKITKVLITELTHTKKETQDSLKFIQNRYNVTNVTEEDINKLLSELTNGKVQFYAIGLFEK